jgi:murein DD-endopeptidase MepM/ murein hydrolase activator NlpD
LNYNYRKKKRTLSPWVVFLLVGTVFVAALVLLWLKSPYLRSAFDRTAPRIEIQQRSNAVGTLPSFLITAQDDQGAPSIEVAFVQGEKRKELAPAVAASAEGVTRATVVIPGGAEGFADGKGMLEVKATDSGMWGNAAAVTKELVVDSRPPKIEVVSLQHVVAQGGSELVLVKAQDENLTAVGALVGGVEFPAFKLSEAEPFFANIPEYYGVLLGLPLQFDADRDKVEVFAADIAGNIRKVPLSFRIARARQVEVAPKLTVEFLRRSLPDLLASYARMTKQAVPSEAELDSAQEDSLIGSFRLINQDYRGFLQQRLTELLVGRVSPRGWSEDFIKPMKSATTSIFGERRTYSLNGKDAGGSIHYGLDLASVANDVVRATNAGKVIFAGEFGIYGETVILDHGLGLSSLYGHLASTSVVAGDAVALGAEVGRSGKTGLAGGDHLHFEYRINNVPVTPIEWWDPKWVRDHLTGKIEGLKVSLEASSKG